MDGSCKKTKLIGFDESLRVIMYQLFLISYRIVLVFVYFIDFTTIINKHLTHCGEVAFILVCTLTTFLSSIADLLYMRRCTVSQIVQRRSGRS